MTKNEMIKKIEDLQELEAFIEEIKSEAEDIRDEIKAEMLNRETEEITAGRFIVRWTSVLTQRFDSTTFKKEHADMYKLYTMEGRLKEDDRTVTEVTQYDPLGWFILHGKTEEIQCHQMVESP